MAMSNATEINRAYYNRLTAGQSNYWALMPAPKMRIDSVVSGIEANMPAARSICDFGCGNGALLLALAERCPDATLYGIDLSDEQIRQNAATIPGIRWGVADLAAADFECPFDTPCQVAVSSEVIEHLDRPLDYLGNIRRCMADGGLLVLTTQSGPVHATERYVGHVRHWEPREMEQALTSAGFESSSVHNCGFPFHDLSKWAANLRPALTVQRFGDQDWGLPERTVAAVLRFLFRFNSASRGRQLVAVART
jgi:cyclopropane fatty-acyl-phospholipid synthase-like methyltransferase